MENLLAALVWGTLGFAYFIYGKKRENRVALLAGIALCAFPYFVENGTAVWIIGALLAILPFVIRD